MSGTSLDGLDVVCATFNEPASWAIEFARTFAFPSKLAGRLSALAKAQDNHLESMAEVAVQWSEFAAQCIEQLLSENQLSARDITAIGSHGQTIRHCPNAATPFSVQIGCPSTLSARTHITVVADFRSRDIAAKGQGAPLVPAFHGELFPGNDWLTLNLGGIANIAYRNCNGKLIGYDTGPANTLINQLCQRHFNCDYDDDGEIAQSGSVQAAVLNDLLNDAFFQQTAPKSTGPEYFNLEWFDHYGGTMRPEDAVATATELSARSIALEIAQLAEIQAIWVFGGGVKNSTLMKRLQHALIRLGNKTVVIHDTQHLGIDPDFMEALVFAWLAERCLAHLPGNCPSVTGAEREVILGGVYPAS
jgi:anhydro-N-acetylmuramic acid kinase